METCTKASGGTTAGAGERFVAAACTRARTDGRLRGRPRAIFVRRQSFYQGTFDRGMREKGKFSSGDGGMVRRSVEAGPRHRVGTFHLSGATSTTTRERRLPHGRGSAYADGTSYEGEWKEDSRHGEGSTFLWTRRARAPGAIRHGSGSAKYADGGRTKAVENDLPGRRALRKQTRRTVGEGNVMEGEDDERTSREGTRVMGKRYATRIRCLLVCGRLGVSRESGKRTAGCRARRSTFTKVSGPAERGVAGEDTVFTIAARDEVKNKRLNGGDDFVRFENNETGDVAFATSSTATTDVS